MDGVALPLFDDKDYCDRTRRGVRGDVDALPFGDSPAGIRNFVGILPLVVCEE